MDCSCSRIFAVADVYDALPTYDGPGAGVHPMSFSTSGVPIADAMPTVLDYLGIEPSGPLIDMWPIRAPVF